MQRIRQRARAAIRIAVAFLMAASAGLVAQPAAQQAAAQQSSAQQSAAAESVADHPELTIPRLSRTPALEDFLSMEPQGETALQMTRVTTFRQRNPHDGDPVSEATAAYLGYDQKNLYVIFVCHDDPKKIRGRMSRREDVVDDDQVEIMLDTFHDQRRAYAFLSTPLGIQWDAIWNEAARGETNGNWDPSWDAVWTSRGKLTDQGYVVSITIPFKSLRFPAGEKQEWGVILYREITRKTEDTFWPYVSYKIAGRLRQAATLKGLEGISPGRDIELIPYGVMRGFRALDQRDPANPYFQHAVAQGQIGMDAKFVFHDHFTLDATVNPDFSQVESNDPQVTVNQRFAVYFPEKRPFFLENEDFFRTPIDLFFTRNIADPSAGLRLTGKQGPYSVGLMTTDDRTPGLVVPDSDKLSGSRSYYTIARVSRDILKQSSSVGLLYTDWEYPQARQFNRIGGVDARFRLGPTWSLEGQAVVSSTNFGTYQAGPADRVELKREALHFSYDGVFDDISPGFTTVPGFINRTDIRSLSQSIDYRFRPKKGWIVDWGPSLNQHLVYDHEGTRLDTDYYPYLAIQGRGQTFIFLNPYEEKRERLRPQDFAAIGLPGTISDFDYHEHYTGGSLQTSYFKMATIFAGYTFGDGANFVPASGLAPQYLSARVDRANGGLTIRPIKPLKIENTYLFERLRASDSTFQYVSALHPGVGKGILDNHIFRSKWNWQFTPRLSMRLILQYYSVLANTPGNTTYAYTFLPTQKQFNADFLITYLVHPGTAVYVGYNSDLQNYDHRLFQDPLAGLFTSRGYINDGRQFFVKVNYQFRF